MGGGIEYLIILELFKGYTIPHMFMHTIKLIANL